MTAKSGSEETKNGKIGRKNGENEKISYAVSFPFSAVYSIIESGTAGARKARRGRNIMLDYTKMAIRQTVSDLRRVDYIRNVATQIIYILYLVYNLIAGAGYLALNIVLLVISAAYFAFFLTVTACGKSPEGRRLKKRGTAVYVWCKRLIKLFTLGLTVYGICTAVEHVSALSVILAALMIVGWCLQIVFEVLIKILTNRVNFLLEALEADLDGMLKPVRTVGNFFKKIAGKEVPPPKQPTKNQLKLKEKVEAFRAEQKRKKAEDKLRRDAERAAGKEAAREEKKRKKQSARIEAKLLKAADKKAKEDERDTSVFPLPAAEEPEAPAAARPSLSEKFRRWLKGEPLSPEKEVFEPDAQESADASDGADFPDEFLLPDTPPESGEDRKIWEGALFAADDEESDGEDDEKRPAPSSEDETGETALSESADDGDKEAPTKKKRFRFPFGKRKE